MSRFLTPSKVGLLVLVAIYTEDIIPASGITSVLSFLISQILPDCTVPTPVATADKHHVVPLRAFETNLSTHLASMPGRTIWDYFLKRLWLLDCSDALDVFFSHLPALLSMSKEQIQREKDGHPAEAHGKIVRSSPLGAFVRRCHLEYTRLQFQDGIVLWQAFIHYRAPSRQAWEKKNLIDGRSALDVNFSDLQIDASHPLSQIMYGRLVEEEDFNAGFSLHDVEKLMEFQVSELQRLGGRLPDDMKGKIQDLSQSGSPMPKLTHYLKFLDSWRAGDYPSAFDNLHRYFDYTMQSRDRTFYQYALLNLAILQADFGCYSEAIPAMQEAIATARENKDATCLNFCMSWLYHFGKTFPAEMQNLRDSGILGSEIEGLAFLKSRAKDAEMWSLLSTSLLSEAKLGLQHGDSLAIVFENIAKATHVNLLKSVGSVTGPALIMKGSVYSRVGLTHLAWSCGETFLQCHAREAPAEDVLKCTCRMASLQVQGGRYNQAMETLSSIPDDILRVLKYQQYWTFYSTMLKLRRCLHRSDISSALNLSRRLAGQKTTDLELRYALSFLEIDLLTRRGILNEAMEKTEALASKSRLENSDVMIHVKLLNIKARILTRAGHPLKGFTIVVRAASMAHRARLLPVLWEATGILSNILIELKEFSAAACLLEASLPQVLECQDCDLAAWTYSHLVDAYMGLAGEEDAKSTKQKEQMSKAMVYIDSAHKQFRHIEDLRGQLEMLAKRATILHWRGDLVLANDVASQYLELKKEYAMAQG